MRSVLLAIVVIVSACERPLADDQIRVDDRVIRVVGNHVMSLDTIAAAVATYSDYIELDVLALYWDARYADAHALLRGDVLQIDEGQRFSIGDYRVTGIDDAGHSFHPIAVTSIRRGDVFSRQAMLQDKLRLEHLYRDASFAMLDIIPATKLDRARGTIDLVLELHLGPPVTISTIEIVGAPAAEARKRLAITPGQLYNETAMERTKQAIAEIARVDISYKSIAKDRVAVTIELNNP